MSNTADNTGNPSARSNRTPSPATEKIREKAEQKAKSIPLPNLGSMTHWEIQQLFYEMQVKKFEAELQNEQCPGRSKGSGDQTEILRIVTENMLDLVALTDIEGNFTFAGKSHEILGYEPSFLIGKNVMDFVHPDDLQYVLEELTIFIESSDNRTVEYRYRCKNGTYIWLETNGKILKNENDIPQEIVFSSRDVTDRKQVEHKLRESEKKYRFMTEQMNDVVWTSDLEMRITYISPSDERILGFTPEERIKHTLVDMLAPFSKEKAMEVISKEYALDQTGSTDSHRSVSIELEYRHKDGSTRWLETLATGIRDDEGRLTGLHGVSRDITERKRAEEELRESEEKHRRLFETMAQGVIYQDAGSGIISANPAAERILGLSFDQMRGMKPMDPYWKMIKEDSAELSGSERPAMIALRTGETIGPVIRGVFHPGKNTYVWLSITAIPLFQPGEAKPFQAYATFEDVTERKQAIEDLKEREAFIQATLDNLPVGVAVNSVDPKIHFTYMNENFARFYRTTREALSGANDFWELVYTDETFREEIRKSVLEDCASNDPEQMYWEDVPVSRPGKKPFYITAKNIPLPESNLMVSTVWDVTERKRAEDALRQRESLLQRIFDILPIGLWFVDKSGRLLRGNRAGVGIWGAEPLVDPSEYGVFKARRYPSGEAITPDTWALASTIRDGATILDELLEIDAFDGKKKIILNSTAPVLDEKGNIEMAVVINQDVTEREQLQSQLNQAQKMESVGRLAGGVAHDFNNKLTIINGYTELAMETIDPSDPLYEIIQEIHTAGKKSADIVRQLLAFARKQTISPVMLDLNDTISGMLKMLQRLIGENIDLAWHPGNNLWPVKIDPSQVDQIMANLAVNSRDAISDVGKLTIETKNTIVDENYCKSNPEAIAGQYVMLAVSDNGCGMEKQVQDLLFEPFFTTKEIGKGTGLGLPTIYGIVKQNKGFINVYSEPGEGTTFKLYFPAYETEKSSVQSAKESGEQIPAGTETILVVEDEKTILQMARQMLERLGYTVETAGSPAEALQISKEYDATIHLLIADVIMPDMNGRDLSVRLSKNHPALKTLYMSGYTADVIAHHGMIDEGVQFIQKPFSLRDLADKVREVIEQ